MYSIHNYVIKVCQWLATDRWFSSLCTPVSSINKTDRHDITEILLKVVLNTINPAHINEMTITEHLSIPDFISTCFNQHTKRNGRFMVFNATFNNISVISWRQTPPPPNFIFFKSGHFRYISLEMWNSISYTSVLRLVFIFYVRIQSYSKPEFI